MNRRGNGTASNDEGTGSPGEQPDDERVRGALTASGARAAEIPELSRRALSAEVHLLAYVDELEREIRRLRRRLGADVPYEAKDGTA